MNRLAVLRKKAKLTQSNVSDELKIDRSTIAKWENGTAMPRAEKLPLLAALYKCSVDDLFKAITTKTDEAV